MLFLQPSAHVVKTASTPSLQAAVTTWNVSTRALRTPKSTHGNVRSPTVSSTLISADAFGCPVETATNEALQPLALLQLCPLKVGMLLYTLHVVEYGPGLVLLWLCWVYNPFLS